MKTDFGMFDAARGVSAPGAGVIPHVEKGVACIAATRPVADGARRRIWGPARRIAAGAGVLLVYALSFQARAQFCTPVEVSNPGGTTSDCFGWSVAVSGDTMIVGEWGSDVGANFDQGAARIYRFTASGWAFEASLTALGGASSDNFGRTVAIDGDTAVVGAFRDNVGANADQGSAYVFVRSGTTWTPQAQLNAVGGAATDYFGFSVAVSGDTAVVGATQRDVGTNANQGAAYVFVRSGTVWAQQAQLSATAGAFNDQFGWSVAIDGDTAVVGAYADDVGTNPEQGSACVFVRSGTVWAQQALLTALGGATGDGLGVSVAISGDTVVAGAYGDDVGANTDQGSGTVFVRTGTAWAQQAQLIAADGAPGDGFGFSVGISGNRAVVGAWKDDVGANTDQGSAYVFGRTGTVWSQEARLDEIAGSIQDIFGVSAGIAGDTVVVGSYLRDVGANPEQGSVWAFSRPLTLADHPAPATSCPAGPAAFTVAGAGTGARAYQWEVESPAGGGIYVDLTDPAFFEPATGLAFDVAGATADTLVLSNIVLDSHANLVRVRAAVSNSCGSLTSNPATLTLCRADYNCDGFMDGIDYDLFNADFENYDPAQQMNADYNGDGFVDGIDYDLFNIDFAYGC